MMEHMTRCTGTPTTSAACPRLDRLAPARGRSLHLGRTRERSVVRSYPSRPTATTTT